MAPSRAGDFHMSIQDLIAVPVIFFLAVYVVIQLRAAWEHQRGGGHMTSVVYATLAVFSIAAIVYLLGWTAP